VIDVESLYAFVRDRTYYHAQQQLRVEQTPYLISKVSAPIHTFIISATNIERPINRVLVLTEDPLVGRLLETGIKLNPLARDAVWVTDLEQALAEARTRFEYDAVYLDVRSNLNLQKSSPWSRKKEFISLIRKKYPIIPFVLVGVPELFLQRLEEQDRQRFEHYFFFDMRRPMTVASTLISDTLAQVEWDIRLGYGEQTSL
jgi:hypothetical protein